MAVGSRLLPGSFAARLAFLDARVIDLAHFPPLFSCAVVSVRSGTMNARDQRGSGRTPG